MVRIARTEVLLGVVGSTKKCPLLVLLAWLYLRRFGTGTLLPLQNIQLLLMTKALAIATGAPTVNDVHRGA